MANSLMHVSNGLRDLYFLTLSLIIIKYNKIIFIPEIKYMII